MNQNKYGYMKGIGMSALHTTLKRITKFGLILMMGVSMTACFGDQHWKEEVQLGDGRIIVVERDLITESGGDEWAINRSGSKPKEYRIRFEYPLDSGKTIEWKSTKADSGRWPELPLVLDVEEGFPVVFSRFYDSVGCDIYLKYVYQNGVWVEERLPSVFEPHATNLFLKFSADISSVDLKTKRKLNSDVGFRHIQQVGPKHPYCR
ncbi:MAG TPA: hypothetical protein VK165_06495 [Azonexus sp.]|nr:hypothetical protein [Azonexus sp.]